MYLNGRAVQETAQVCAKRYRQLVIEAVDAGVPSKRAAALTGMSEYCRP